MADRLITRIVGIENSSSEVDNIMNVQGVAQADINVTVLNDRQLLVYFWNAIPVVSTDGTPTVQFEYGSDEPDWTTYVSVADGDHSTGFTLTVDDSAVDMDTVGTFDVGFIATDSAGNASDEHTITITIVDTTIPVITAEAVDVTESEAGTWTPNGTALDGHDGDITADLVITYAESDDTPIADLSAFQTHIDGLAVDATAKVIYNVDDASGNSATEVTQVVTIVADA